MTGRGQGGRLWMGGVASQMCILRCLKGGTWSDMSFESGLLVCVGNTEGESAGQGGQMKGMKREPGQC